MSHIRPRLRKPLARAIAGTVLVGAWAVGSPHWWLAVTEVVVLAMAVAWYVWAGQEDDEGALLGSRADERQKLVGQQARALAGVVGMATAYTGLAIALAVKPADAWPFAVVLAVTGFGYLFGLSTYGSGELDGADSGHEARFPVSH